MNNFELDEQAQELSDKYSAYKLARMYLETKIKLQAKQNEKGNHRIGSNRSSPCGRSY